MHSVTRIESTRSQVDASASGITSPDQPGSKPEVKKVVPPSSHAFCSASRSLGEKEG
jgi:hypothetical protein